MLSNADHWEELTGLPVYKYYEWQSTPDMGWHREIYKVMYDQQAFDVVQPDYGQSLTQRQKETTEIVHRNGAAFFHDKKDDRYWPVPENIHNAASGGRENETRHIYLGYRQDVVQGAINLEYGKWREPLQPMGGGPATAALLIPAVPDIEEIKANVDDYFLNEISKFVMCERPMSEYDSFISELENLGLNELIEKTQAVYDIIK